MRPFRRLLKFISALSSQKLLYSYLTSHLFHHMLYLAKLRISRIIFLIFLGALLKTLSTRLKRINYSVIFSLWLAILQKNILNKYPNIHRLWAIYKQVRNGFLIFSTTESTMWKILHGTLKPKRISWHNVMCQFIHKTPYFWVFEFISDSGKGFFKIDLSIFINNSGSNKMIFQQHIVHRFICQFVDIYKLVRFYESIKEPLCKIIICRAIFQWMKAHIRCIIPHPVASEHRWLVKAPRWIHSVPDVSDRRSWRCGCQARL